MFAIYPNRNFIGSWSIVQTSTKFRNPQAGKTNHRLNPSGIHDNSPRRLPNSTYHNHTNHQTELQCTNFNILNINTTQHYKQQLRHALKVEGAGPFQIPQSRCNVRIKPLLIVTYYYEHDSLHFTSSDIEFFATIAYYPLKHSSSSALESPIIIPNHTQHNRHAFSPLPPSHHITNTNHKCDHSKRIHPCMHTRTLGAIRFNTSDTAHVHHLSTWVCSRFSTWGVLLKKKIK